LAPGSFITRGTARLDGTTATHNIEKFWEHMRRNRASPGQPMTDEQRRRRPPVVHPVFLTHPITGRKVLYCNPGFTVRINELPEHESDEMLEYLFAHQLQKRFRYTKCLDRERSAGLGSLRHDPSCHCRLWPGRNPPDPALAGDGHQGVRSRISEPGARARRCGPNSGALSSDPGPDGPAFGNCHCGCPELECADWARRNVSIATVG